MFVAELRVHDILISIDGHRRYWVHGKMEHFRQALKYENIQIKEYVSVMPPICQGRHYIEAVKK